MNALTFGRFPFRVSLVASLVIASLGRVGCSVWADQVAVDCSLNICRNATNAIVSWQFPPECGTNLYLQVAPNAGGSWSRLTNPAQPLVFPLSQGGSELVRVIWDLPEGSPNASQIDEQFRNFAFSTWTNMDPATQFNIRVEPVQGLWETMQIQLMIVPEFSSWLYRYPCLLHNGKVQTIGICIGGYGLMSGLVQGTNFYYTYSWGSGIHRSQVGKAQIVDGQVNFWETTGFWAAGPDLFLSRRSDGKIAVVSGTFEGFNVCQKPADYGLIDETDPANTKVIDLNSNILSIMTPVTYADAY